MAYSRQPKMYRTASIQSPVLYGKIRGAITSHEIAHNTPIMSGKANPDTL